MKNDLTFYEQGAKAGKLLAWQISQLEAKQPIINIIFKGNALVDPVRINDAFRNYYEELYSSTDVIDLQDINHFLDKHYIPRIPTEGRVDLELGNNSEDIGRIIDCLKSGKRARPDGIPMDLYKNIQEHADSTTFKQHFKTALLPKPGKTIQQV